MTVVLVTGANRGIGLEFVRQYAQEGANVIACCREPEKADALAKLAGETDGKIAAQALDVRDAGSVELLKRKLDGRPIDILINNAGVYGGPREKQSFGTLDYHAWSYCFETNLYGPMRVSEALIENVAAGKEKKIASISSLMGSIGDASGGSLIYRTSKTALNMAMHALANDLAGRGVIVLPFHPGWVQTDMGGPNALIDTKTSVKGMRDVIARADQSASGRFWNYDGRELPW